jgi:hypothetical protein
MALERMSFEDDRDPSLWGLDPEHFTPLNNEIDRLLNGQPAVVRASNYVYFGQDTAGLVENSYQATFKDGKVTKLPYQEPGYDETRLWIDSAGSSLGIVIGPGMAARYSYDSNNEPHVRRANQPLVESQIKTARDILIILGLQVRDGQYADSQDNDMNLGALNWLVEEFLAPSRNLPDVCGYQPQDAITPASPSGIDAFMDKAEQLLAAEEPVFSQDVVCRTAEGFRLAIRRTFPLIEANQGKHDIHIEYYGRPAPHSRMDFSHGRLSYGGGTLPTWYEYDLYDVRNYENRQVLAEQGLAAPLTPEETNDFSHKLSVNQDHSDHAALQSTKGHCPITPMGINKVTRFLQEATIIENQQF